MSSYTEEMVEITDRETTHSGGGRCPFILKLVGWGILLYVLIRVFNWLIGAWCDAEWIATAVVLLKPIISFRAATSYNQRHSVFWSTLFLGPLGLISVRGKIGSFFIWFVDYAFVFCFILAFSKYIEVVENSCSNIHTIIGTAFNWFMFIVPPFLGAAVIEYIRESRK